MSIVTSVWVARHQLPATSRRRALVRLMLMLRRDEQVRPRAPVTLPGPPRNTNGSSSSSGAPTEVSDACPTAAASPPPAPTSRVRDSGEMGRRADRFDKAKARAFEPGDQRNGDWTREQLIKMDARFRWRLGQAINRGLEQAP
jgi:hypothetical protein